MKLFSFMLHVVLGKSSLVRKESQVPEGINIVKYSCHINFEGTIIAARLTLNTTLT